MTSAEITIPIRNHHEPQARNLLPDLPNAVYANKALKHACWALGASAVAAILRPVLPAEAPSISHGAFGCS